MEIYEPSIMSSTSIKLLVGLLIVELIKLFQNIKINSDDRILIDNNVPQWYMNPNGYPNKKDFEKITDYIAPKKGEYSLNSTRNKKNVMKELQYGLS